MIKKWYRNLSLTLKTGLMVTISAVVGIALIMVQVFYTSHRIFTEDTVNKMYDAVDSREKIIENYISSVEEYMRGFAEGQEVKEVLLSPDDPQCLERIHDYVKRYAAVKGNFEGLYVCDTDTTVISHTLESTIGVTLRTGDDREAFKKEILIEGKMSNRGIMISPATGELIISMYYPVFENGTCLGYVGGAVYADEFMNDVTQMKLHGLNDAEYVFINAANNVYLYNEDETLFNTETTDEGYLEIIGRVTSLDTENIGSLDYKDANGHNSIVVYKYLPDRNWVFMVKAAKSDVFGSYYELLRMVITIAVIALAIIILVTVLNLRRTGKELRKIELAVERLSRFELDCAEGLTEFDGRYDECGNIANAVRNACMFLKQSMGDTSRILTEMSEGNLTVDVHMHDEYYIGDFSFLAEVLDKINLNFNSVMSDIARSAEQVETGSEQVSSGAQSLSESSAEQSAAIDGLAENVSSIEEQVKNNAAECDSAQELMEKTFTQMSDAAGKMNELAGAMDRINMSSNQIDSIIKTIEDIAFQTNILALNAAVEAARAGEAGKGFAVVADEVRNLAAKSSDAVGDTAKLIEESRTAVSDGAKITEEAEISINALGDYSRQLKDIINEVAASGERQIGMVQDINNEIERITAVVQTNSATAQQSAAASKELAELSGRLSELIGQFKIN